MDLLQIVQPVILCGGAGSRLWPLSREMFPKQLLSLTNQHSLLQNTILRIRGIKSAEPILVSNEQHRFIVAEQLRAINVKHDGILLEPVGRNTAPAIAVAALHAIRHGQDPILIVLPADHTIEHIPQFEEAILKAVNLASEGALVTFGIVPKHPETGYGYIRQGQAMSAGFKVSAFVEKPNLELAKQYLESGEYLWNSGMFVFRASQFLAELATFEPHMLTACQQAVAEASQDLDFIRLNKEAFAASPDNSIDYAVMERTTKAAVVSLDAAWNDIGSFAALWQDAAQDTQGNAVKGDVLLEDSKNCYVHATQRLVTVVGAEDLIVVETADAVLVAPRHAVQDVKKIVSRLKQTKRAEATAHRRVYRPWGYYEGIDQGQRYQVKRIGVNPEASLSLQMHHHRAEHWIVVNGTAEVTCEDKVYLVTENQSTYIPLGHKHRLRNVGKIMLEMIEVQSGSYLGEDDIVRFEDVYGRT
ncbi:mannose-1-phosphate guanylyltransferase/mannose-6-phosphate isomerase [Agitococcus lubricus]